MAIQAQTVTDRVRNQLIDNATVKRWTDAELLNWLSDGQRTIVAMAPSAAAANVSCPLVAGTKQSIPADGHILLSILRNNVSGGGTPGKVVRIVSREIMDNYNSDWHSGTPYKVVQNYIFDPQDPTHYYVYPPNDGTGYVDMVYAKVPAELTALTDTLTVQDVYQTALFDYVMFRAHQKDSDFAAGQAVAQGYLQAFLTGIGQGETGQLSNNPNLQLAQPDPSNRGSAKI